MGWDAPDQPLGAAFDDVGVRPVEPADVGRILDIEADSHPTPWSREVFEREFGLDWSHAWSVVRGSRVVGFVVFWVIHDEVHILNIAVAADARRQGIASTVIEALIELAGRQQASFVTLEVRHKNAAAIGLYESLGFRPMGRRDGYYSDTGEDAVIMSRLLT